MTGIHFGLHVYTIMCITHTYMHMYKYVLMYVHLCKSMSLPMPMCASMSLYMCM